MTKNFQVDAYHYIRVEDDPSGDVLLTLVEHDKDNKKFEFLSTILIPKQQRNNIADFLKINE